MSDGLELEVDEGAGSYWTSVADLMSGLMIVFLFIAIAFMAFVTKQRDDIKEVAVVWKQGRDSLYRALENEFRNDLQAWNAELDAGDLSI